ncbi:hypothetical protein CY34DRAFT_84096 [Suillus luteus UH-Slu-Lm8-n1]|uniref:Myb/SANT-like domain-containing protein n=1 Tax=Suillus luteus UH-Slu-Lm8-n1 TaxID=930992 RepID=A0A0D0AJX0_9AGAM|nr:hypothetical protein CY34DRAFT_84096 [Suillus luteus UH-Slu-Lm8-n1]
MCATRNAQSCKNKWTYLKAGYNHVVYIKNASGLSWSDADGVEVSNETKHIWEQIVKVSISLYLHARPGAKPFGNKGFPHFETIDEMMKNGKGGKNKPKGGFVH